MLEELLALVPPAAPRRARVIVACAAVEHHLGRHEEAHRRLVTALEHVVDQESPEAVSLMLDLGMDAFYLRQYAQMRSGASRTRGRTGRRSPAARRRERDGGVASAFTGRIDEARTFRDEAASVVDSLADDGSRSGSTRSRTSGTRRRTSTGSRTRSPTSTAGWPSGARPARASSSRCSCSARDSPSRSSVASTMPWRCSSRRSRRHASRRARSRSRGRSSTAPGRRSWQATSRPRWRRRRRASSSAGSRTTTRS